MIILLAVTAAMVTCGYKFVHMRGQVSPYCKQAGADKCAEGLEEGKKCLACPLNGDCHDGKLNCLEGFTNHGELCLKDDANPMELELVKYLGKIDAAIVAGQTFKSFGAEQADAITGKEILEHGLL